MVAAAAAAVADGKTQMRFSFRRNRSMVQPPFSFHHLKRSREEEESKQQTGHTIFLVCAHLHRYFVSFFVCLKAQNKVELPLRERAASSINLSNTRMYSNTSTGSVGKLCCMEGGREGGEGTVQYSTQSVNALREDGQKMRWEYDYLLFFLFFFEYLSI